MNEAEREEPGQCGTATASVGPTPRVTVISINHLQQMASAEGESERDSSGLLTRACRPSFALHRAFISN